MHVLRRSFHLKDVGNIFTTTPISAVEPMLPIVVYNDVNATVVIELRAQKRPIPQLPEADKPKTIYKHKRCK